MYIFNLYICIFFQFLKSKIEVYIKRCIYSSKLFNIFTRRMSDSKAISNACNIKNDIFVQVLLLYKYGFKQYEKYVKDTRCNICLDTMKDTYVLETGCGHPFHRKCLMQNISNFNRIKCPEPKCNKKYEVCDDYFKEVIVDDYGWENIKENTTTIICPLCQQSTYMQHIYRLNCGDLFHKECMIKYFNNVSEPQCPQCKAFYLEDSLD